VVDANPNKEFEGILVTSAGVSDLESIWRFYVPLPFAPITAGPNVYLALSMGRMRDGQATQTEIRNLKKSALRRMTKYDEARALVKMGLETYWPRRWYFDPKSAIFGDCRALQHFVWTGRERPITQVRHLVVNAMFASGTHRAVLETFLRREFKTTTKIARLLRLSPA
jgi:hypothetical protein